MIVNIFGKRNIYSLISQALSVVIGLTMLLYGCVTVGPDYIPPEVKAPLKWSSELSEGLSTKQPDKETLGQWWKILNDPELTDLINRAVASSPDLRDAASRIREARAKRAISASERFYTIDATGSATRRLTSKSTSGIAATDSLYEAGFDAGWELDMFGRIQRQVEASEARLHASEDDYRNTLVTLTGDVALNYVEVRSYQTRLTVAWANRDAQAKTMELVKSSFEGGEVSRLDLEQARSSLEITRSEIPSLEMELSQAKHRLAVLIGQSPGSLNDELARHKPVPVAPSRVAVGVPADVLRRRPDIRSAELRLSAQTAEVGVATAALYPKFTLFGSIGLESIGTGDFLSTASRVFSIGPSVTWNVFDAGKIRQSIEVENALQEQALIAYEAAILKAMQDVEDTLVAYGNEMVRRQSLIEAEKATQREVEIAMDLYSAGETDFLAVLDAQRSLLSIQDDLAQSNAKVTTNVIRLYKALGGGWTTLAPESAEANAACELKRGNK